MPVSPSDSGIFGPLFNDPRIAEVFSDERYVEELLAVEAALARVLGRLGLIPSRASELIARQASDLRIDVRPLREGASRSGIPIIELVRQLREQVGEEHSRYVHWGATSQDIMDTARVLQVRSALQAIEADLGALILKLADLAQRHRHLLMTGRTHSQPALPITFGYKVAAWLAPLLRHRDRLGQLGPRALVLQFGGAVGTLAAYGDRGEEVFIALGEELKLALPSAPWHSQRDGFAELAGWLSLLSGSLAKMAQDVILLGQSEIGELRESSADDRGGSSTMPQKSNPVESELIVAASRANASLLSIMHAALVQEHERGTHGLQLEWIALPQMFALTTSALSKAVSVAGSLVVDGERMRKNVQASHGTLMAEAIRMALLDHLPGDRAEALVKEASRRALAEGRPLLEVVREGAGADLNWDRLEDEAQYLGATQWFIDRVLGAVE